MKYQSQNPSKRFAQGSSCVVGRPRKHERHQQPRAHRAADQVANVILSRQRSISLRYVRCDTPNHVETGPLKNKSIIPVPFFEARKLTVSRPALPRISPQIHHQNTTFCHPFSPKTPVKHHKQPQQKKCKKSRHFTATKNTLLALRRQEVLPSRFLPRATSGARSCCYQATPLRAIRDRPHFEKSGV